MTLNRDITIKGGEGDRRLRVADEVVGALALHCVWMSFQLLCFC